MKISAHGLAVDLPPGWDARIFRRPVEQARTETHPILHAGNFALPLDCGDYGSGAVEIMGVAAIFVALKEFAPEAVALPLFAARGRPDQIPYAAFSPNGLQRAIAGHAGAQFFFTENDRPYCLYVVLGSYVNRSGLAPAAGNVVERIEIGPASRVPAGLGTQAVQ